MDRFKSLEKMLEIIEAMKKNVAEMMDAEIKSQLLLRNPDLSKYRNEGHAQLGEPDGNS